MNTQMYTFNNEKLQVLKWDKQGVVPVDTVIDGIYMVVTTTLIDETQYAIIQSPVLRMSKYVIKLEVLSKYKHWDVFNHLKYTDQPMTLKDGVKVYNGGFSFDNTDALVITLARTDGAHTSITFDDDSVSVIIKVVIERDSTNEYIAELNTNHLKPINPDVILDDYYYVKNGNDYYVDHAYQYTVDGEPSISFSDNIDISARFLTNDLSFQNLELVNYALRNKLTISKMNGDGYGLLVNPDMYHDILKKHKTSMNSKNISFKEMIEIFKTELAMDDECILYKQYTDHRGNASTEILDLIESGEVIIEHLGNSSSGFISDCYTDDGKIFNILKLRIPDKHQRALFTIQYCDHLFELDKDNREFLEIVKNDSVWKDMLDYIVNFVY